MVVFFAWDSLASSCLVLTSAHIITWALTPISSPAQQFLCVSASLCALVRIGFRATTTQYDLTLINSSAKTLFISKVVF